MVVDRPPTQHDVEPKKWSPKVMRTTLGRHFFLNERKATILLGEYSEEKKKMWEIFLINWIGLNDDFVSYSNRFI
jgi:hypothetical protein